MRERLTATKARIFTQQAIQNQEAQRIKDALQDAQDAIWKAAQDGKWDTFIKNDPAVLRMLAEDGFQILDDFKPVVKVAWRVL